MKVLLIGGTGNISTATVRELKNMGADVTVFNRGTYKTEGVNQIVGDRYDTRDFISKVSPYRFDCVIDMICYEPKDAQALATAFAGKTEQIIFCSTVNTFAAPAPTYPITENTPVCTDPEYAYAHGKELCERLLTKAADNGAFKLTIIQPGATGNDTSLPVSFLGDARGLIYRMLNRKPILLFSDGATLWTMAHRDDVGKAIAKAVCNPLTYGERYILAAEEAMTWERYYEIAANAFGAEPPKFVYIPWETLVKLAPDDCSWVKWNFRFNNIFSCEKAKRDLGFSVTVSYEEIMRRAAAYHNKAGDISKEFEHPKYDGIVNGYLRSALTE